MSGGSTDAAAAFRSRLFFTLVEDLLAQAEFELVEVKSVRFLADYPWTPGKRLRPITFLLSNFSVRLERGVSLESNGRESRLAAAIELLHEASLVHDDLVDGSSLRRGAPAMHMMNGQGLALLIGDYMVFRGLKLILDAAESRDDIVLAKELANTGLAIAQGEADQLDRYLRQSGLGRADVDGQLSRPDREEDGRVLRRLRGSRRSAGRCISWAPRGLSAVRNEHGPRLPDGRRSDGCARRA